jgi:hypothetical protein
LYSSTIGAQVSVLGRGGKSTVSVRRAETPITWSPLRTITPIVVPPLVPFRNPEHRELYLSGLRLAAGEAT